MAAIQHTAARRAAGAEGKFVLTRRGSSLCLATEGNAKKEASGAWFARARTYDYQFASSGLARDIEAAFHGWLERVPELRREPQAALGMVVKYQAHLPGLLRAFEFQRELQRDLPAHKVIVLALHYYDAALAVAYRRCGRWWK